MSEIIRGHQYIGKLRQTRYDRLTSDVTSTAVDPAFTVLNTVTITTVSDSRLNVWASSCCHSNGPAVPVMFGIRIDGSIIQNTTVNVTGAIDTIGLVVEHPVSGFITPGSHTVELVFRKFNQPFVVIACRPAALPTLFQSNLLVKEVVSP